MVQPAVFHPHPPARQLACMAAPRSDQTTQDNSKSSDCPEMPQEDILKWIEGDLVRRIMENSGWRHSTIDQCHATALEGMKDNWASKLFNLTLGIRHANRQETYTFLIKLLVDDQKENENMRSNKQFRNEINMYKYVLPLLIDHATDSGVRSEIEATFPKCYYSYMKEGRAVRAEDAIVVMENLKIQGYKLGNRSSLDIKHCTLALQRLGSFHALSYYMKERHASTFKKDLLSKIEESTLIPIMESDCNIIQGVCNRRVFEALSRENYPEDDPSLLRLKELTRKPYNLLTKLIEPSEPMAAVCHGDFCRNNMLFKYEDDEPVDVKFVDLQVLRYCSPAIDISFFIFMNTTAETRAQHFDGLLREYHSAVAATLTKLVGPSSSLLQRYSFEAFMSDFKKHALYGYLIAVEFLPWMLADEEELAEMVRICGEGLASRAFEELSMVIGGERVTKIVANMGKELIARGLV